MNWSKCAIYQELISLKAANRLPEADRKRLESHLAGCRDCREQLASLLAFAKGIEEWRDTYGGIQPRSKAHFRLRQALKEASQKKKFGSQSKSPRRALWGSLGAIWTLVLFFNLSGPKLEKAPTNAPTVSIQTALMVLKEARAHSQAESKKASNKSQSQPPSHTETRRQSSMETRC